jgi:hypothetical protein
VFDIAVNGQTVLSELDIAVQYGERTAVTESFTARSEPQTGLEIRLNPIKGKPVLGGLVVSRMG